MRQKKETATSFNQLKEITQAIQAQKRSAKTSDNAKTSENANASEPTQESTLKPKATAHAKNHALKPTKRAFSERINAFRDNSQASDEKRTEQDNQQGDNANAFKSDEAEQRGQQ